MAAVEIHDVLRVLIAQEENAVDDGHHGGEQSRAYPAGKTHTVVVEFITDFIVKVAGIFLRVRHEFHQLASDRKHMPPPLLNTCRIPRRLP